MVWGERLLRSVKLLVGTDDMQDHIAAQLVFCLREWSHCDSFQPPIAAYDLVPSDLEADRTRSCIMKDTGAESKALSQTIV